MFQDRNYERLYFDLIEGAQKNPPNGYTEKHHIIPRSMGGGDGDNVVVLTAYDHLLAHYYLYRGCESRYKAKAVWALACMFRCAPNQLRIHESDLAAAATMYAEMRQAQSILLSSRYGGSGNPMYGRTHDTAARQAVSEANRGRPSTLRGKIAFTHKGTKRVQYFVIDPGVNWERGNGNLRGRPKSECHKAKLKQPKTESHKAKLRKPKGPMSAGHKEKIKQGMQNCFTPIECPHCGLVGKQPSNMRRYHFDNCKEQ